MSDELINTETQDTTTTAALTVSTDQADYAPGSTATFTAENVTVGGDVTFDVDHVTADGTLANDISGTAPVTVTDGGAGDADGTANGSVVTTWAVNQDAANQAFVLTATDETSGKSASTSFTDAGASVPANPDSLPNGLLILTGDDPNGTGTGTFPAFVQIQGDKDGPVDNSTYDNDGLSTTEEGFNTDFRGTGSPVLDTDNSLVHNHSLLFAAVPLVTINGTDYREFRLDLGEGGGDSSPITLDALKVNFGTIPDPSTFSGTEIYNMDGGLDGLTGGTTDDPSTSIQLSGWATGQGGSDYKVYIPESYFTAAGVSSSDYIYLYSAFSDADSEFEEWSVGPAVNSPNIVIDKVTVDGDVSGDGISVTAGDDISWVYTVVNNGNVDLFDIVVTDDNGTPGDNSDDLSSAPGGGIVYVSGDDGDNILQVGEVWTYQASGTAGATDYNNIGTVTGNYVTGKGNDATTTTVSDTDPSSYIGQPNPGNGSITIDKVTVDGTIEGDDLRILAGESISWKYTLTNTGTADLSDVSVTDSVSGVLPTAVLGIDAIHNIGDTNTDGILNPGESWIFTAAGTATEGAYSNIGTAHGTRVDTQELIESPDDSSYTGVAPHLTIDKVTVDGATEGDGLTILVGEPISWKYTVTNDGTIDLATISVTDSVSGIVPTAVLGIDAIHNIGDTNTDGILNVNESWVYSATGTSVLGSYSNTGTANGTSVADSAGHTGSTSDTDDLNYNGVAPHLTIDKVTVDGATEGDGLTILVGEPISWKYTVTNDGTIDLATISVTDSVSGVVPTAVLGIDAIHNIGDTNTDGILNVNESWVYSATGTSVLGSYSNTGTANGTSVADSAGHTGSTSDTDDSNYNGVAPHLTIDKVTVDGATEGDGLTILVGEPISWKYTVTNDGTIDLATISVTDSVSGVVPTAVLGIDAIHNIGDTNTDGILNVNESWVYSATGTSVLGSYSNTGTANGTSVADSAGHTGTASDTDDSSYFGAMPSIDIVKTTTGYDTPSHTVTGDNISVLAGYGVTWTYTVTNTGNVALSNVTVTDNQGVTPTLQAVNLIAGTGDLDGDGKLDTNETWIYTATGTAGFGPYSNTGTASGKFTDDALHAKTVTDDDGSSYTGKFIEKGLAWTKGFWSQHLEAWNGVVALDKKGVADTQSLVNSGVLAHTDIFTAGGVDSDGNGVINTGVYGVLLGDSNGNFKTDPGEDTLFVSLAAAQQIINSADSATDTRQILMSQALAAQLNIYNGAGQPNDLIKDAVMWLKGEGPYNYATESYTDSNSNGKYDVGEVFVDANGNGARDVSDGSTGKVDTNGNGILDAGEYSTTTKAFALDANGGAPGTALTSNLQAWQLKVDVDSNNTSVGTNVLANGEGLKNALMYFNDGHLVVSGSNQVGWDADGAGGSNNVADIHLNALDNFWDTLHEVGGLKGIS